MPGSAMGVGMSVRGLEMRMRHKVGRLLGVAGAACVLLAAGGCSRIREHQGFLVDQLIVDSVLPGVDNRDSVEGSMGRPTFVSQFGPERWYYISRTTKQLAFGDPKPTDQYVFVIKFDEKGNVASIDKELGITALAKISPEGEKTPTLGRERSVFDDVFGNIGTVGAGGLGGGGGGGGGPNGG
jgi:outer membrane protein assembly factor BamE (lipoprotein component of BamABCDE complex)